MEKGAMAKTSDVVKDAVTDLNNQVKDIKQGDEEDLGVLSNKFFDIAERADSAAQLLAAADRALDGEGSDKDEPTEENDDGSDDQPEEKDKQS